MINPMIVDGQVAGGSRTGHPRRAVGGGRLPPDGRLRSGSFMDYLIPTAVEVPTFELGRQITPSPVHELGTYGIGEGGALDATEGEANAIPDALSAWDGTRLFSLDRVFSLIRAN